MKNGHAFTSTHLNASRIHMCIYTYASGSACGVTFIVVVHGHGDSSSNPGRDCISHRDKTLGKGMHPTIHHEAMGKIVEQSEIFNLSIVTSLEEKKIYIKTF